MPTDFAKYVALADALFPKIPPHLPLKVCGECCCPMSEQEKLLATPRLEIPNPLYYSYAWAAASSSVREIANEIRYFLPRIILATVRGEEPAIWESMLPGKLGFNCDGVYSRSQLQLVHDFARDYVGHCCHHDTPLHPEDAHLGEVIAGFAETGLDNIDEKAPTGPAQGSRARCA